MREATIGSPELIANTPEGANDRNMFSYPLDNHYYTAKYPQAFHSTRTNGIYSSEEDLIVAPAGGLNVNVSRGRAWLRVDDFKGIVFINELAWGKQLEHAIAPTLMPRIDRIVIRHDFVQNDTYLAIAQGVPGSQPVAPTLQRDSEAFELGICDVRINPGQLTIDDGHLRDLRLYEDLCGIMRDGVTGIPTQTLIEAWDYWFKNTKENAEGELGEWMETTKDGVDAWINATQGEVDTWKNNTQQDTAGWIEQFKQLSVAQAQELIGVLNSLIEQLGEEEPIIELINTLNTHLAQTAAHEDGVHGLRIYENHLQGMVDGEWQQFDGGEFIPPPPPPPPLTVTPGLVVLHNNQLAQQVSVGGTATGNITVTRGSVPAAIAWSINNTTAVITFTATVPSTGEVNGMFTATVNRGGESVPVSVSAHLVAGGLGDGLGDLPVGSVVWLRESGVRRDYIVAHQGRPSAAYQGLDNATILLRERTLPNRQMHGSNVNDYQNSTKNAWLNGEYFNTIDAEIRNHILQIRIPFRPGSGTSQTVNEGANGLQTRIFLPSHTEVGYTNSPWGTVHPTIGARFSHFLSGDSGDASTRRIAQNDAGVHAGWWLRSPDVSGWTSFWLVNTHGSGSINNALLTPHAPRPAFALPANMKVAPDGEIIALPPHRRVYGENIDEQITAVSNYIEANEMSVAQVASTFGWNIGDTRNITFQAQDDTQVRTYQERIMGVRHPTDIRPSTNQPAGLTLEFVTCVPPARGMNGTDSNRDGWDGSELRGWMNSTLLNSLPAAMRTAIKQVRKPTANRGSQAGVTLRIIQSVDSLWLQSSFELSGQTQRTHAGEGAHYMWYAVNAYRVKLEHPSGSNALWRLRSPIIDNVTHFSLVGADGQFSTVRARNARSISLCYCR